jgi:hypothetical protein
MTRPESRAYALAGVFVLWNILPCRLTAQHSNPCQDTQTQKDWDSTTSPVYADAMDLARTLNEHGVVVNCIRRSKGGSLV